MRIARRIGTLLATTALATGAGLLTAPTASAANPCWQSGGNWWCDNVPGAAVYKNPYTFEVVGHMYSNPSWFKCRYDFGGNVGGPHPNRWIWTQADNGAWGWMKDTDIYSETDPLPAASPSCP
ncbi:hypothetical protein F9278_25100 [Streptomyces phaeolivaceus]|uniref:Peptidase inhibitor family I36 protein n=1 Tax=Streptomyces phaeolivaceus TaxID=2653200 RepID=A0A5P8K7V7_9ACTN|nr:hypothetical protein [Streptomyces phaeolivaceus]QFQ98888.1 hypothetical protein F9278_25100 [Streptomyces phaeolivaceus]